MADTGTSTNSRPCELSQGNPLPAAAWVALLGIALLWSYWPTIAGLTRDWRHDDNYSVGQLVPLAALYLVWHDRRLLADCATATCWWGAAVIILAQIARGFGLALLYESAERYSLVVTVAGVVLLVGGWRFFRKVLWVMVFLILMVPLPGRVHNAISAPLQTQATIGAVFLLELMGMTVVREGNVIILNDLTPLAVAEACSGLRLLTAFVVVGSVFAYVAKCPRWQKTGLILSTIPIAIACNLIRLVITAKLFVAVNSSAAEKFFHDFAGLTMMPLAVAFLLLELWVMGRLVTPHRGA